MRILGNRLDRSVTDALTAFDLRHFVKCTETTKIRHYTEELCVRTQMSESVRPDIKWKSHCLLFITKSVSCLCLCLNRFHHCLETSFTVRMCVFITFL